MPRRFDLYILDVLDAIAKIEKYTANISVQEFKSNSMIFDAVLRNLEIIGEASKNLPKKFKDERQGVEWKKIAGLRDIVSHEYFGVDVHIIWDVIKNKLPELKDVMKKIKNNSSNTSK